MQAAAVLKRIALTIAPLACQCALRMARIFVPAVLRAAWDEEWAGDLWQWMIAATREGDWESARALLFHTKDAIAGAYDARFRSETGAAQVREVLGSPHFCVALCVLPLALVALFSGGFRNIRQLMRGVPYPDAQHVTVLAQGPPTFGVRLGFSNRDLRSFEARGTTFESIASYVWRPAQIRVGGRARNLTAAYVSPEFFEALGIKQRLKDPNDFVVSYGFWKTQLGANPNAIGHEYLIGDKPFRLSGVLPQDFVFLNPAIQLWMLNLSDPAPPPPPQRWWLALKGAIARLRPDVPANEVENELRLIQLQTGTARPNFQMKATPIGDLVSAEFRSYGSDLLIASGGILLWAVAGLLLERRRGMPWRLGARYWGFFALKPVLLFLALFGYLFEFTGVNALGMTGGLQNRGGPLLVWGAFTVSVIILFWAWRDQPTRCRVCLNRMHHPLRIGVPGQILLETSGQEVMCPKGHGSVYTSASVLGANLSNRWMGFEDVMK